jgi:hypothetical protein
MNETITIDRALFDRIQANNTAALKNITKVYDELENMVRQRDEALELAKEMAAEVQMLRALERAK